jgi:hypothetical protein
MIVATFIVHLLSLSQTLHAWRTSLASLEATSREKIALYAEAIAATLARAAAAFTALERDPADPRALRDSIRELARLSGYVEDVVAVLDDHLDGRKVAGLKRRLEGLASTGPPRDAALRPDAHRIEHLIEAEGHFRALADALRT